MGDICELMYKCRMCGKVFLIGIAPSGEITEKIASWIASNGRPFSVVTISTHGHDDGSLGIADFAGIAPEQKHV